MLGSDMIIMLDVRCQAKKDRQAHSQVPVTVIGPELHIHFHSSSIEIHVQGVKTCIRPWSSHGRQAASCQWGEWVNPLAVTI